MRELRDLRLRRGLSQADLSAKTGVAEFTISQIEAGKRANPRPSTLRKLAQALEVEVADLYGSPEHPLAEASPSPEQPPLNGFEEERRAEWDAAVRSARQLRERGRTRMEEILAAWRESKYREEDPAERRPYLYEMGDLLQQAYDAETTLWETLSRSEQLLGPDELSEIQAARSFYDELWPLVQGGGLSIRTDGSQLQEGAQQEQLESHTVEERSAA